MTESTLEKLQGDVKQAMKAGDRDRVGALRMLVDALQKDAKEGGGDEVAVLQRERKKRLEAAEAYSDGGGAEQAERERGEAELIAGYLPEQIGDEELAGIVAAAIEQAGAEGPGDIGKVMGAVMPQVKGKADGKRVSAAVREQLA